MWHSERHGALVHFTCAGGRWEKGRERMVKRYRGAGRAAGAVISNVL
jgi:hypothetical protein